MSSHFLNLLDELVRRSLRMAAQVEDMVQESCEAIAHDGARLARRVIERDADIDAEEVEVESEAIRLMALFQPVGADLRLLCTLLKVNNDLERIADCAVNIAERAAHLDPQTLEREIDDVRDMCPVVQHALQQAINAYRNRSADIAEEVLRADDAIDALYAKQIREMIKRAEKSNAFLAAYLDVHSIAKNLERIADLATNIAEDVIFMSTGHIVRHARRVTK